MLVSAIALGSYALAESHAQIVGARDSSSRGDREIFQLTEMIATRGLAGGAMSDPRATAQLPSPRSGASVSESIVKR